MDRLSACQRRTESDPLPGPARVLRSQEACDNAPTMRPGSLPLTFNDLLRIEGVAPADVVLVRHQDAARQTRTQSLYRAWKDGEGLLERYQEIQHRRVFEPGQLVASFVVTPPPESQVLFVGLFHVADVGVTPPGTRDPVFGNDVSGVFQYTMRLHDRLAAYIGKLRIEWGPGARSWRQLARRQNKPVAEIRSEHEPPFPGFALFQCDMEEISRLPRSWVDTLRNVKGIYLLVDRETGKQYVGSAIGADSLWGRWRDYAATGHGGDIQLRKAGRRPYRVAILQAVPMVSPDEDVLALESLWKEKLMTRTFGLNAN